MTDQDKIEKAREALKAIKNGVNLASYVRCSPHEWPKGDELAKVMWSLLEANESLHEIVEMLDAAPVSGGEEQAALDALEWFITELKDQWDSCDLTDADVSRFERNAKTIRKALQSRPEVVTVNSLIDEAIADGDAGTESAALIEMLQRKYPNGVKITP